MGHESDPSLLALHGLRLKGRTQPEVVAGLYGLDTAVVEQSLQAHADAGSAQFREGRTAFWMQTPEGKAAGEALLAAELDAVDGRATVTDCYARFKELNGEMLAVCTRWQVRDIDGEQAINDHTDQAYDDGVVAELAGLDEGVRPIIAELSGLLTRFAIYEPRFDHALGEVRNGNQEWFTRPIMESYHTVWFELHEDFFATLGIDRASES